MQRLLESGLQNRSRAEIEIAGLVERLPSTVLARMDMLLATSPAPEQGLHYFTRLREVQAPAFERLTRSGAGLRYLIAIFTHSHFLAEEALEHPRWVLDLLDAGDLHRVLDAAEFRERLESSLGPGLPDPLSLAAFRRRQILRIVIRDVLGFGKLPEITAELSGLADAIVEFAYARIHDDLVARFGRPHASDGSGEAQFSVIALGKLGGVELNYSSDIDLMFLYSANGETTGRGDGAAERRERITNKEFFKHAANQLTAMLSAYTAEGLCYRVDLRLRPDGRLGEVCISLDGARQYYANRARDWELQMMIKARVAAGDRALGRTLLDFLEPRIYSSTLDFSAVEALSATRERLNEKLAARRPTRRGRAVELGAGRTQGTAIIDVKLERGGIRDIEFVVQCLQRLHGGAEPWVRHGGTLLALARLRDKNFLSDAEYGQLASAYQFLRHLEHRLQFADDLQTHALPVDRAQLELLARRMPGGGSADTLLAEMNRHFEQVIEIYERVVHARPARDEDAPAPAVRASNLVRALNQRAPSLSAAISGALASGDLDRGYRAFEHFLERLSAEEIEKLDADPGRTSAALDVFEHSPYFAEQLIRTPELAIELSDVTAIELNDVTAIELSNITADKLTNLTGAELGRRIDPPLEVEPAPTEMGDLRRWYARAMLRIQSRSICRSNPIFETLTETSALADAVIGRAYEIAVAQVRGAHPPRDPSYRPSNQMWVIALGRLGMREFDLASDADLVFVLADSDSAEMEFWTRAAERVIDLITAYTGSGFLFAVDTRLRPNGSGGLLVQTEAAFRDYFARAAEAWEGITYMKSRAVAGDATRAEAFLHQLQEADWLRYGQSGRSRADLRQMRLRLEREQGAMHPLKAGRGGYYDIDFLLMYLRLKSAGIFFKVLNTPARIEVIESLGYLDRSEARFLSDVATFYRALDHGLRLISGHAEGKLPSSDLQIDTLGKLLKRWTPIPLSDLAEIRARTRAMFDRVFA